MNFLKTHYILCSFLACCPITLSAQSDSVSSICDTIYTHVEEMPEYKEGTQDILKFVNTQLLPIINDCMIQDSSLLITGTFAFALTIDRSGKVIDVSITRPQLADACANLLKEQLLAMTGWKPGRLNGHNVCTSFHIPVRIRPIKD